MSLRGVSTAIAVERRESRFIYLSYNLSPHTHIRVQLLRLHVNFYVRGKRNNVKTGVRETSRKHTHCDWV